MKTVKISDEVWNEIAKKGKFGETEDDVLRRIFDLKVEAQKNLTPPARSSRQRIATKRLSSKVENGKLYVEFADGDSREWTLPSKNDKSAIREITYEAMKFAQKHGATHGQILAVRKCLTNNGYHLTK